MDEERTLEYNRSRKTTTNNKLDKQNKKEVQWKIKKTIKNLQQKT